MSITPETRIGQIATEHPLATRVFARHGIDYCCGGGRALAEACREKGLDAPQLVAEILREIAAPEGRGARRFDEAPLAELVDHIVEAYHRPLYEELPRLEAMARKVHAVHGDKDPRRFADLLATVLALRAELEPHLEKEERELFPRLLGSGTGGVGPTVASLVDEHNAVATLLRSSRDLTGGFVVPAEACNTWRALWHGLAALEHSLHEHIHLENNVLFRRALSL